MPGNRCGSRGSGPRPTRNRERQPLPGAQGRRLRLGLGDNANGELGNGTNTASNLPVQASINLGPSVPPDQGNVLLATRSGGDVVLTWTGTGTSLWSLYRDPAKRQLGFTPIPPTVNLRSFVDAGRAAFTASDYYRLKGLYPCGAGL